MKNTSSGLLCWFVLACLWMCPIAALAQQNPYGNALTNNYLSQTLGPTSPGSAQFGTPYLGTSALAHSSAGAAAYSPTGPPLAEWGPFGVYPHLLNLLTYGNGIQAQPGVNSTTVINTVSPGVFLRMGSLWFLDYTPCLAFYSNPIFHDTLDQRVVLHGATTNGNWMLSLSQNYVDTTQPVVETGTQFELQAYATAMNAVWQMGGKSSLELGLSQIFRISEGLNNMHEWSTAEWYNYQFQPQFGAALGVTGGYDELSLGSDNPFEQALGRVNFQPGSKLTLTVMGGVEDRQFVHPSGPSVLNPVFDASARYLLGTGTLLTVSGNRVVTPSLIANDLNVITTVNANVRQRIIGRMFFEIEGGYAGTTYTSIVPGPLPKYYFGTAPHAALAVIRSDTRTYGKISLSTVFGTRLTGSIFYMISDNASSQSNFRYSGNEVGLNLDYRY